jgi:hypothetical protein
MEEELFNKIGQQIEGSLPGKLFGKATYNIRTKPFISYFGKSIVCKLQGDAHQRALNLEGAKLFDPSGKGRPMREWVQIPYQHNDQWLHFAEEAKKYALVLSQTRQ